VLTHAIPGCDRQQSTRLRDHRQEVSASAAKHLSMHQSLYADPARGLMAGRSPPVDRLRCMTWSLTLTPAPFPASRPPHQHTVSSRTQHTASLAAGACRCLWPCARWWRSAGRRTSRRARRSRRSSSGWRTRSRRCPRTRRLPPAAGERRRPARAAARCSSCSTSYVGHLLRRLSQLATTAIPVPSSMLPASAAGEARAAPGKGCCTVQYPAGSASCCSGGPRQRAISSRHALPIQPDVRAASSKGCRTDQLSAEAYHSHSTRD